MKQDEKELIRDALGLLRDDLVADAQLKRKNKSKRRFAMRMLLAASLAAVLLAGVCIGAVMHNESGTSKPSLQSDDESEPQDPCHLYSVPNVWDRDDFSGVAFVFQNNARISPMSLVNTSGYLMLSGGDAGEKKIDVNDISVGQSVSVGLENLIADRYAVAYDEHFYPVFYDLSANTVVDLDAQILGEQRVSIEPLVKACMQYAEQLYPGILGTKNNRELLTAYVYGMSRDLVEWRLQYDTFAPDLDFLREIDGFRYDDDAALRERFFSECFFEIFRCAYEELETVYQHKPCRVEVMGMDGKNGTCLVVVRDLVGNGLAYLLYDFKTGGCLEFPRDRYNTLLGTMWGTGDAEFRFSADGKVITVVYPDAAYSGGNIIKSYLDRYTLKADRDLFSYRGEHVGVFYMEYGTAVTLPIRASSEAFLSESGNVVYYKRCDRLRTEQTEKDQLGKELGVYGVKCPDEIWYSRLHSQNKDTDHWVFASVDPKRGTVLTQTVLQGNFVRLMADETVVLMEKDGIYTAYALASGEDVTAEVSASTYEKYGYPYHERLAVYEQDGMLYQKDVFGVFEPVALAQMDQYVLSEDGAFAFVYSHQTGKASCINVASGQSVDVKLSEAFLRQLNDTQGAELVISYNEYENTLLFSLCAQPKNDRRAELAQAFADTMLDP